MQKANPSIQPTADAGADFDVGHSRIGGSMETIESVLKFIGSYPIWAKALVLIGLGISVATLVFAPRQVTQGAEKSITPSSTGKEDRQVTRGAEKFITPSSTSKEDRVFMKIKAIQLFPDDPEAEVQVICYVNGIEFIHPSVGGVNWMRVGPSMSEKIISLPKAASYDIRFEMRFRSDKKLSGGTKSVQIEQGPQQATSQMVTPVTALPFSEEYSLYLVNDGSRAASVKAIIPYEIYRQ